MKAVRAKKPYEIECCAVGCEIPKEIGAEMAKDSEKVKEFFEKVSEDIKGSGSIGVIGVYPNYPMYYVLFKVEDAQKALDFYKTHSGSKLVKEKCFVDGRYFDGEFKNFRVDLPIDYLHSAVKGLLDKYCKVVEYDQDIDNNAFIYQGDLGGRAVYVYVYNGGKMFACGLKNAEVIVCDNVSGNYKRVLAQLEEQILSWREEHGGCIA